MRARHPLTPYHCSVIEAHATSMRHAPTRSEEILWRALSGWNLGVLFRRQVRIGKYVAEFAAAEVRLVVEVDGAWHAGRGRADQRRDRALARAGWRVVRLEAQVVEREVGVAVERVWEELALLGVTQPP